MKAPPSSSGPAPARTALLQLQPCRMGTGWVGQHAAVGKAPTFALQSLRGALLSKWLQEPPFLQPGFKSVLQWCTQEVGRCVRSLLRARFKDFPR